MIYQLIQYTLLFVVCTYLVNYYSSKEVSIHVKIWSVITWVLNFGLALLVPEDVFQTLQGQKDIQVKEALGSQYLVLYWSVYLLTWTIIPVLQEWEDAGDLQSTDRLKRSLRINGIFYLVLIIAAIFSLIVLIMLDAGGQMGLITFLKCLATIWGILLMMILMGYSLVQIPKTMWRNAKPQDYLQYLHHKVIEMQIQVEQSIQQFKIVMCYINYVKKNTKDAKILEYCESSIVLVPQKLKKTSFNHYQTFLNTTKYLQTYPICLESSIEHRRLMKRSIARWRRQQKSLADYIRQSIFYEDIQQAIEKNIRLQSLSKKTNSLQNYWYCKIRTPFNKCFSVIIGFCSFLLLVSQTQVFLTQQSSLLAYLLEFDNFQVIRILVFIVMAFIIYMSNYALFRLKLANLYGLYYKQSDGASLMFATVNFSRIGVAIVLNFFDMIKMENSIYGQVMQAPKMGLLGQWVIKGLPGVLWLIVLCHYFNFWGWLSLKLGVDDKLSFSSHEMKNDGSSKRSPKKVQQKRIQLDKNYSNTILQFQELQNM